MLSRQNVALVGAARATGRSMASHVRGSHELAVGPVTRRRKALGLALGLALFVAAVAIWASREASERHALRRMPPAERRALYEQTLKSTESLCDQAEVDHALLERCRRSAQFLLAFPECDERCQTLVERHRNGPTR